MKRFVGLFLIAVALAVVFGRATCGKPKPAGVQVVEAMKIRDNVFYHNIGITHGDGRYYTINGGNDGWSVLNVYDERGELVETFDVGIDGRAIFYHPEEDLLYVKGHGTELYSVDPEDGDAYLDIEDVFEEENSSPGFSPDGEYIYEPVDGEVRKIESTLGTELYRFALPFFPEVHGFRYALAASDGYLFAWEVPASDEEESEEWLDELFEALEELDDTEEQPMPGDRPTVYVYSLDGEYLTKFALPRLGFGFSLSWANGMLWVAEDADGIERDEEGMVVGGRAADGYWYGYRLENLP